MTKSRKANSIKPALVALGDKSVQFQIGDRVVHPIDGVGTVKSITRHRLVGDEAIPYYEVVTESATIWVPVETQSSPGLRAIVSKAYLAACRELLASNPIPLDKNFKLRHLEISTRLKDGSLASRCAIVRDLGAYSLRKPLCEAENALLKRISNAVSAEWAASEGVTVRTASTEIQALLDESRLDWMPDEGDGLESPK